MPPSQWDAMSAWLASVNMSETDTRSYELKTLPRPKGAATRVIYTEWLFFALLAAGIFVLHWRGQYTPKFLAFGYPLLPAISFLTSAAIAVNQIWASPRDSVIGLSLLLLGLPVYFFWAHRNTTQHAARGPSTDADDRLS